MKPTRFRFGYIYNRDSLQIKNYLRFLSAYISMHEKIIYEMVVQNAHNFSLQKLLTSRKHGINIRKVFSLHKEIYSTDCEA